MLSGVDVSRVSDRQLTPEMTPVLPPQGGKHAVPPCGRLCVVGL